MADTTVTINEGTVLLVATILQAERHQKVTAEDAIAAIKHAAKLLRPARDAA